MEALKYIKYELQFLCALPKRLNSFIDILLWKEQWHPFFQVLLSNNSP